MNRHSRSLRRASRAVATCCCLAVSVAVAAFVPPAGAQYGGVSGLFVSPSEEEEGAADYTGLGCNADEEVVLYLPALPASPSDPPADTAVPGRIIAVTTSLGSADPLLEGTFEFLAVFLPAELEPGVYEVHSRCGDLDLEVLVELGTDGDLSTDPDPDAPVRNPSEGIPDSLPLTGREASRVLSLAAALVAAGIGFIVVGRRRAAS